MRPFFIVNPVSSGGRTGRVTWPRLEAALGEERADYDSALTCRPGHAVEMARDALWQGYGPVVAVGGDGTVNEVGNGLLRAAAEGAEKAPCLGIIPGGRGSDLCRTLGIPRDPGEALRVLLQGSKKPLDAGLMRYTTDGGEEERFFFNMAGMGFDAETTDRANHLPGWLGGTLTYFLAIFVELYKFRMMNVRITIDGEVRFAGEAADILVANGKYAGGGMLFSPRSQPGDGFFEVIVLKRTTRRNFIYNFARVYRGTHLGLPIVEAFSGRVVEVESRETLRLQPDGEVFGRAPVRFECVRGALRVVAPVV